MTNQEKSIEVPSRSPLLIGLTGGIGAGKTAVARIIAEKGYPVYNSDVRAKEIVNEAPELKKKIITLLGDNAYDEEGNYHRKWVAEQIFSDDEKRLALNDLIHPAVKKDFEKWLNTQSARLVFKETALLFELDLDKDCHQSILVTADNNLRIKRVMDRDGKTYREVETIMQKQMPEAEKRRRADFIIENNADIEALRMQVEKVMEGL